MDDIQLFAIAATTGFVNLGECQWFLMCDRPAVKHRDHSILGEVPICGPCDLKIGRLESKQA
jgi:hypothetical protein